MNVQLYVARREHDLKQKEVAEMLGIHPQTYHLKEIGKKEFLLNECKMLTKIFKKTLDELFGG